MESIVHFVSEIKRHCHEDILHEVVRCIPNVGSLMPANIGVASDHWFTIRRTKLQQCSHLTDVLQLIA